MDFYNTLYWSERDGIYSIWGSVYPALSFLLLRGYQTIFMNDLSGFANGFDIRREFGNEILPLLCIYAVSLYVSVRISYGKTLAPKDQLIIFIIFLISMPFLFALERGNLILLSLPILSWYIFSNGEINRSIALGVLINLKPYFLIFYIFQLLNTKKHRENKVFLFLAPMFTVIIFLITGLLLDQEFYLLPINILGFAADGALQSPTDVLSFPSSIASFSYFKGLITDYSIPPIISHLIKAAMYIYMIKCILVIYKGGVDGGVDYYDLTIFSVIFVTNYSTSTGGYALLYYLPIVAILYKQKQYVLIYLITLIYMGFWDLIPIYFVKNAIMDVYLGSDETRIDTFIGLGSIMRPLLNVSILIIFFYKLKNKYIYE